MFHKKKTPKKKMAKLRNQRGAALLEVIIALLFFSMASLVFFQQVYVAVSINDSVVDLEDQLSIQRRGAENQRDDPYFVRGTADLEIAGGGGSHTVRVDIHALDDASPAAYR